MKFNLTKNKMDLNIWKMTNHPPSPRMVGIVALWDWGVQTVMVLIALSQPCTANLLKW